MIRSLKIRDFAIVPALELEFGPGLQVFTGETGAGKSIVIEAISFLLGARGTTDWIRAGADRLSVEGRFAAGGRERVLRRELDAGGRGRAFLDGAPVPASALAALGDSLVDFHGQHEHQSLFKPALQLELLDAFGGLEERRAATAAAFKRLAEARAAFAASQMSAAERERALDLFRWQAKEIDEVSPRPGEEEELEALLPRLKNAEKLRQLADQACGALADEEGAAAERLAQAVRACEALVRLDPSLQALSEAVEGARLSVEETARALSAFRRSLDADPEALDALLGRQDRIARLKRKYGATVEDVLATREKLRDEIEQLEHFEEHRQGLAQELETSEKAFGKLAGLIHKERLEAARRLAAAVTRELKGLGMPGVRFSVSVELEEERVSSSGSDDVEFLIAPNPGEPLKPLRAVASGGEISRTMLGLKTVLASQDRIPVLVFDEVDSGVGGAVARAVGERLAALARRRQVLCVTHLPQVASFGARHFRVWKEVVGGRTAARAVALDDGARREEIARMLSGREVTKTSLSAAEELLAGAAGVGK